MVADFGLAIGTDLVLHDLGSVGSRDRHAAFAAVYFGGRGTLDLRAVDDLIASSAPIIPTIPPAGDFGSFIPRQLQFSNGLRQRADDPAMTELSTALLECLGLLRRQRRVFVSYRRAESQKVAVQLHDLLTSRGFDVFLDTHDVRPGEPFQDVLWQRLCDSDVMMMLDTPTYFDSKWTRHEIGRAMAKEIHVLRLVWPGLTPSPFTALSETIYLEPNHLRGIKGPLMQKIADAIVLAVERLRSRSIASRYMSITGKLRAEVERIGGRTKGIGSHRAIGVDLPHRQNVWAYPVVGIPTAELFNDIVNKARRADQTGTPILVYDHVGISDAWIEHLKWLDKHLTIVRAIKVSEAGWALAAWEG
jgi:TIR domain